jgi:NTE family protein
LREFRAISFVKRLIAEGNVAKGAMKDVHLHLISDEDLMGRLTARTKMLPNPGLLWELKAAGRAAAEAYLKQDGDRLGIAGSVDLEALLA